jgi:hypothetical protein
MLKRMKEAFRPKPIYVGTIHGRSLLPKVKRRHKLKKRSYAKGGFLGKPLEKLPRETQMAHSISQTMRTFSQTNPQKK